MIVLCACEQGRMAGSDLLRRQLWDLTIKAGLTDPPVQQHTARNKQQGRTSKT